MKTSLLKLLNNCLEFWYIELCLHWPLTEEQAMVKDLKKRKKWFTQPRFEPNYIDLEKMRIAAKKASFTLKGPLNGQIF